MKRAMTEEAKTAPAKEILDTAERLFLESGYRDLKMSHIAKAAGISNGLLFVYFKTKETLFLCLLWREYEKRLDFLEEHVRRKRPESFSDIQNLLLEELTLLLETNPLYIRLEALRAVILERGADTDTLCRMKKRLSERTDAWSRQLEESGVLSRERLWTSTAWSPESSPDAISRALSPRPCRIPFPPQSYAWSREITAVTS